MAKIQIQTKTESDLTVFTIVGELTAKDIRNSIHTFYEGNVTLKVLWDMSQSKVCHISADDVQSIAYAPRKQADLRKGGKTAIVAPSDIAFGLTRMYEFITETQDYSFETQTFRTTQDACRWLLGQDLKTD